MKKDYFKVLREEDRKKREQELKQSLSFPIPKSKIRHEIGSDIKEVILKCMEIDEAKRITVAELANRMVST